MRNIYSASLHARYLCERSVGGGESKRLCLARSEVVCLKVAERNTSREEKLSTCLLNLYVYSIDNYLRNDAGRKYLKYIIYVSLDTLRDAPVVMYLVFFGSGV